MNQSELDALYSWFDRYVEPFLATDQEAVRNIQLKIIHTGKVCDAMTLLAEGEGLSESESRVAAAIALLHDVGRFPQYRRWRTFRDSESDNHARLAIEVIRRERLLDMLAPEERLMIEEAVRFHNMLAPPEKFASPVRTYIDLIRDADKLDIWRVFAEQLALPPGQRASAATLGLPDHPEMASERCVATLSAGAIIPLDTVSCVNDFILLQISWAYDLTCRTARRLLLERGYIPALAASLPVRPDIASAVSKTLNVLAASAGV